MFSFFKRINLVSLLLLFLCTLLSANTFNTGGQKGVGRAVSAYPLGQQSINAGASARIDFANEGIQLNGVKEDAYLLSGDLFFGYGATNWMDLSIDLPLYADFWDGQSRQIGAGDITLGLKLMHPGLLPNAPFRVSYLMRTTLPTGSEDKGYFQRHSYYVSADNPATSDAFTISGWNINPTMVWTWDMTKMRKPHPALMHINLGALAFVYNKDEANQTMENSAIVGNLAMEFLLKENFNIFFDIYGETRLSNYFGKGKSVSVQSFFNNLNNDYLLVSLGATYKAKSGINTSWAIDFSLSDRDKLTKWDGATNTLGQDYYTTPAPKIGLNVAVGFNKIGKKADPDYDYIPTVDDSCPYEAEDYDQYQDEDGCLDKVHKADTIIVTETSTDTVVVVEKDTITITTEAKKILEYGVITLRSINFKSGSAVLLPSSYDALDDIAASLKKYPEVKIEIRGYTDNIGSADRNKILSKDRAIAVGKYLVKKGVEKNRLRPVGMGEADPVADNKTAEGRILNRRVELKRVD